MISFNGFVCINSHGNTNKEPRYISPYAIQEIDGDSRCTTLTTVDGRLYSLYGVSGDVVETFNKAMHTRDNVELSCKKFDYYI